MSELRVNSPAASAEVIRGIINGRTGPARNIVVANAAAALVCSGHTQNLSEAARRIEGILDDGSARTLLQRLITWTQSPAVNT